jgi:hypothetical protein
MSEKDCPQCLGTGYIPIDIMNTRVCDLCRGTEASITDHTINKQIEELHGHLKEKLVEKVEELSAKTDMEKYHRKIKTDQCPACYVEINVEVDVYDVLSAFEVNNPAVAHAVKKLLAPGKRGFKSTIEDLKEAVVSINRGIDLEKQNERKAN